MFCLELHERFIYAIKYFLLFTLVVLLLLNVYCVPWYMKWSPTLRHPPHVHPCLLLTCLSAVFHLNNLCGWPPPFFSVSISRYNLQVTNLRNKNEYARWLNSLQRNGMLHPRVNNSLQLEQYDTSTEFTEFTEATNEYTDDISRHRVSPYRPTAYYH